MCPICESPHRAEVDAALRTGSGFKALARRFGLDVEAVKAHKRGCLTTSSTRPSPPAPSPPPPKLPYAGPASARAHAREHDPRSALDFDSRVAFIVSEMAAGTFDAPKDGPELAALWSLSADHTRRIVRAAGAAYRASTPDLDCARAVSQGRWTDLYRRALDAEDLRAAAAALKGLDTVSGVANAKDTPTAIDAATFERFAALLAARFVDRPDVLEALAAAAAEIERDTPADGGVSLEAVLAARDAMTANMADDGPPYARARDTTAKEHGEGAHGWT